MWREIRPSHSGLSLSFPLSSSFSDSHSSIKVPSISMYRSRIVDDKYSISLLYQIFSATTMQYFLAGEILSYVIIVKKVRYILSHIKPLVL